MGNGLAFFTITRSGHHQGVGGDAGMKWPFVSLGDVLESAEVFVDGDWVESRVLTLYPLAHKTSCKKCVACV